MNLEEVTEQIAVALNTEGWTCFEGGHEPGHFDDCEDCRRVCTESAKDVVNRTALPKLIEALEEIRELDSDSMAGNHPTYATNTFEFDRGFWSGLDTALEIVHGIINNALEES